MGGACKGNEVYDGLLQRLFERLIIWGGGYFE